MDDDFVTDDTGFVAIFVDGDLVVAVFFGGGANGGSRLADRFLLATGISVSGGKSPISTDIAIALGMESHDLPLGAIHFRRRRFCTSDNEKNQTLRDTSGQTNETKLTSSLTVHPGGNPLA